MVINVQLIAYALTLFIALGIIFIGIREWFHGIRPPVTYRRSSRNSQAYRRVGLTVQCEGITCFCRRLAKKPRNISSVSMQS